MQGTTLRWQESFPNAIINASINKSGYLSVVLEATGYQAGIRVIAPFGNRLFEYIVADDFVLSSEASPSGNEILVNRVKTNGIALKSELEFLNNKSDILDTVASKEGTAFLRAFYLSDGTVAAATDHNLYIYSDRKNLASQDAFDQVYSICEFPQRCATVAVGDDEKYSIVRYSTNGDARGTILRECDMPIKNMSSSPQRLAINMGERVLAIKENGETALDLKVGTDVRYCSVSGLFMLVVTKGSANLYST
jgi:hypothetical protein